MTDLTHKGTIGALIRIKRRLFVYSVSPRALGDEQAKANEERQVRVIRFTWPILRPGRGAPLP